MSETSTATLGHLAAPVFKPLEAPLRRLVTDPKGITEARNFKAELAAGGTRLEIIGDGRQADLRKVLELSILGTRVRGYQPETSNFTNYEKGLLDQERLGLPAKILTILDWDGPMGGPTSSLLEAIKDASRAKGLTIKGKGRVGKENLMVFRSIAGASDKMIVWTSRFNLGEGKVAGRILGPFKDKIDFFPVMTANAAQRIEKLGRGKLKVVTNKTIVGDHSSDLKDLIFSGEKACPYDQVVMVISSEKDRNVVRGFIRENPKLSGRLLIFDSAGWFL